MRSRDDASLAAPVRALRVMGCSQAVRQRFLVPCTGGSNPPTPAINAQTLRGSVWDALWEWILSDRTREDRSDKKQPCRRLESTHPSHTGNGAVAFPLRRSFRICRPGEAPALRGRWPHSWCSSSVGQSAGLITRRSMVQPHLAPPITIFA